MKTESENQINKTTTLPYIQMLRGPHYWELIKKRPTAFVLLSMIAQRARRTEDTTFDDLEIGEALIGDFKEYRVKRQMYRTDVSFLRKHRLITTKTTSRGTIAKLIDTSIFNINAETPTIESTPHQPSPNHPVTTNKNEKNEKNVNNLIDSNNLVKRLNQSPLRFNPSSLGEQRCKEIALALGENDMGFLLSVLYRDGLGIIEDTFGLFKEEKRKGKIKHAPSYFNSLLQKQKREVRENAVVK